MADTWDHIDDLGWRRLRWGAGFVVIAELFTGGAWFAVHWTPAIAPPPAPPTPPTETPPGPQQTISQPPPPAPAPEVAVPVPPKPKPKPVEHRRPVERRIVPKRIPDKTPPAAATTAPPQVQAPPAPASAPPAPVASAAPPSNAIPTWQGQLMGRLEQAKRYPADAQYRGEQGVAYLGFSMNRNGRLLAARIQKSSGYDDLDAETLALIHRAEPLPKPPPEVPGDPIELTVTIQFFLQGQR